MITDENTTKLKLTSGDFTEIQATPLAPYQLFAQWMSDAKADEQNDPNAMALATVDDDGLPNVRIVLLKDYDQQGFVFYTNFDSAKGNELTHNSKAALNFHWKSLRRQVRIRGLVSKVSDAEADEYYQSRPQGSRIGAWASQQSQPLESRATLEQAVATLEQRYEGKDIPRPEHWSGFRIAPLSIEFWHDRPFRLHDRIVFSRNSTTDIEWGKTRLYP
ncbi:MAG: pyridoxamine 5'-phosphate oxidase [Hyphomicrobiales bacterium]|nr:MAG: pyridoxamine 5'-phosphate oxidase [Hyphomicrobiales bacterium]